jgi:hypothetical protein
MKRYRTSYRRHKPGRSEGAKIWRTTGRYYGSTLARQQARNSMQVAYIVSSQRPPFGGVVFMPSVPPADGLSIFTTAHLIMQR